MEIHANVDYCGTKCIFLDPFADRKKKSLNSQAASPVTLWTRFGGFREQINYYFKTNFVYSFGKQI